MVQDSNIQKKIFYLCFSAIHLGKDGEGIVTDVQKVQMERMLYVFDTEGNIPTNIYAACKDVSTLDEFIEKFPIKENASAVSMLTKSKYGHLVTLSSYVEDVDTYGKDGEDPISTEDNIRMYAEELTNMFAGTKEMEKLLTYMHEMVCKLIDKSGFAG